MESAEVGTQVADVKAPEDGSFQLGPALAPGLVQVSVVPKVLHGAGKATIAVVETGGLGDGPPAVAVQLGVEGEVHPNRLTAVVGRRVTGPWARHHEAGTGG